MSKLTEAEFARHAFQVSSRAAMWATECITYEDWFSRPMRAESVSRFTDEIRRILDRLDEKAGRAARNEEATDAR